MIRESEDVYMNTLIKPPCCNPHYSTGEGRLVDIEAVSKNISTKKVYNIQKKSSIKDLTHRLKQFGWLEEKVEPELKDIIVEAYNDGTIHSSDVYKIVDNTTGTKYIILSETLVDLLAEESGTFGYEDHPVVMEVKTDGHIELYKDKQFRLYNSFTHSEINVYAHKLILGDMIDEAINISVNTGNQLNILRRKIYETGRVFVYNKDVKSAIKINNGTLIPIQLVIYTSSYEEYEIPELDKYNQSKFVSYEDFKLYYKGKGIDPTEMNSDNSYRDIKMGAEALVVYYSYPADEIIVIKFNNWTKLVYEQGTLKEYVCSLFDADYEDEHTRTHSYLELIKMSNRQSIGYGSTITILDRFNVRELNANMNNIYVLNNELIDEPVKNVELSLGYILNRPGYNVVDKCTSTL